MSMRYTLFELLAAPVLVAAWFALDQSSFTRWLQLPVLVILASGWFALRATAQESDPRRAALVAGAIIGAAVDVLQFLTADAHGRPLVATQLMWALFRGAVLGCAIAAIPIARQLVPNATDDESADSTSVR